MAETFPLTIVTPTGVIFERRARQLNAVNPLGEFGVLAEHVNFITALVPSVISVEAEDGNVTFYLIDGGFAEVKDGAVTVVAFGAVSADQVDTSGAAKEILQAEQKLGNLSFYEPEYQVAIHSLQVARARQRVDEIRQNPH